MIKMTSYQILHKHISAWTLGIQLSGIPGRHPFTQWSPPLLKWMDGRRILCLCPPQTGLSMPRISNRKASFLQVCCVWFGHTGWLFTVGVYYRKQLMWKPCKLLELLFKPFDSVFISNEICWNQNSQHFCEFWLFIKHHSVSIMTKLVKTSQQKW